MIRSLFLSLRESEFIIAAKISGASTWRIIFRHMLPASLGPIVVNATLQMANLIGVEAALEVIGFGVKSSTPSWGNVLNSSMDYFTLSTEPWAWIPPALLITLTILCINFIGDGLRDAIDPSFEK
ncbi:ABC transporter permease [Alicyclobacillus pomorum]|jgi:peptide/nickel transport system permease protein